MTSVFTNESAGYPRDASFLSTESIGETLRSLVAIDSVNPSHGGPEGGERAVQEWVARFAGKPGLEARFTDALPGRPNLRLRLEGAGLEPPLLFETHVDTVAVTGMAIEPFGGEIRDGRLWGRGSTDAKAQIAAMLHAMAAWAASGRRPPRAVELALVVDEEFMMGGAKALLRDGIAAGAIVIGEPTGLRIVTTHKGVLRWWVRFEGKSAHSARPQCGVNAISFAAALIREIDGEYIPELGRRRAPLLDPPTINVARIQGGVQANLVPERCRVELERRTIPGESREMVFTEFERLIERLRGRIPGFRAVLEPPTFEIPPVVTSPDHAMVRAACAAAAAEGADLAPAGVDYATDAAVLAACGLPLIVVGPGSIDQAHTTDEFVMLEQVTAGARFFADLIGRPWKGTTGG